MKTILILLVLLNFGVTTKSEQDSDVMQAIYLYHEEGVFYFTDNNGESFEFREVKEEASSKYDLLSDDYKGETFRVTYTIGTDVDESDEEYEIYIITDLELVED